MAVISDWLKVTQLLHGGARTPLGLKNSPLQADIGMHPGHGVSLIHMHSAFPLPGHMILGKLLISVFAVLLLCTTVIRTTLRSWV